MSTRPRHASTIAAIVVISLIALVTAAGPASAHPVPANACTRGGMLDADQLDAAFAAPGLGGTNAQEGFGGGDYQHAYPLPDGRVLWLFQDLYFSADDNLAEPAGNAAHNAGLIQDGTCFRILGAAGRDVIGDAQTLDGGRWFWPLDGEIGADGNLWIFVAEMVNPAGTGAGPGTLPVRTWVAVLDPSTLQQLSFRPAPASSPLLFGWSVVSNDEYSFLYGHCYRQFLHDVVGPGQFDASCMPYDYLARVPVGHFDATPQYWTGSGWTLDVTMAQAVAGRARANPMSVQWFGDVWVSVTKIDDWWGPVVYVDAASSPQGPWTTVETIPVVADRRCANGCGNYGAFLVPWLDGQGRMTVALSNGADFALWLADGSLYRPTFYSVAVPAALAGHTAASPPSFSDAAGTAGFVAVDPVRLVDSREPGQPFSRLAAGARAVLDLAPIGVPVGATAVVLNVTTVRPGADGYVRVYPCNAAEPATSNVNPVVGEVQTNGVIVPIGDGRLCLRTLTAVDIVVDLNGWLTTSSTVGLQPVPSTRLVDTRVGRGGSNRLPPGGLLEVAVVAVDSTATAVSLNLTAVDPGADGFVTAWPCGSERPLVSNLNPQAGITQPNAVVVRVGSAGRVCLYTSQATDLVVDLVAEFSPDAASRYAAFAPQRLLDSRVQDAARHQSNLSYVLAVGDVVAAQVTLTATSAATPGFLTAYPCMTSARPGTSNVNYVAGAATANGALLTGARGYACVYPSAPTELVVDLFGVWTSPP